MLRVKSLRIIGIIVLIALLLVNITFWLLSNETLRRFALFLMQTDSESERNHIQRFLTENFLDKTRYLVVIFSVSCAFVYLWSKTIIIKTIEEAKSASVRLQEILKGDKTIIGIVGLLATLGLCAIFIVPINSDEAYAFDYFSSQNPLVSLVTYPAPNNHILFSFISSLIDKISPWDLLSLRLVSLVSFMVTITLLYSYLKTRYNSAISLLSIAGIFLSYFPLFYSVQGRGYSCILLFSTITCIIGLESIRAGHLRYRNLFVLASILGFYTVPIFLYPFTIWMLLFLRFHGIREVMRLGFTTSVFVTLLYSPIILLFGHEVLLGNEFVESLSIWDIYEGYLGYIANLIGQHLVASLSLCLGLVVGLRKHGVSKLLTTILITVIFTFAIPVLQRVFPPYRIFIYIYPLAVIAIAYGLDSHKKLLPIVVAMVCFNLYVIPRTFVNFNQYSEEAYTTLSTINELDSKKTYLLDGPRSIYKWYLKKEFPTLEMTYSLNSESLNFTLLEDPSYTYISEYRWEELDMDKYKLLDSTSYFRIFILK